ncbi:MAG: flagellar protein FlgN [Syntrophomonadaceae bacterium]
MPGKVSDLTTIMTQAVELMDELIFLSDSQHQALKQGNLQVITYVVSQQERAGRQVALLDRQGKQIISDLAEEYGLVVDHLKELLPHIDEAEAGYLCQLRDVIMIRSDKLREMNQLNQALVKQGLKYTNKVLDIINGPDSLIYNHQGDLHGANQRTLVDTKF